MSQTLPELSSEFYACEALGNSPLPDEAMFPPASRDERQPTLGVSDDGTLESLRIAWVDDYSLTRDSIPKAMSELQPSLTVQSFISVDTLIEKNTAEFDLIVFYCHTSHEVCLQAVTAIRDACDLMPLIMLSDLEYSCQAGPIRAALKAGANGFISTRSTSLAMTLSAIRFVQAGGTFAPLEMLIADTAVTPVVSSVPLSPYRLTARQKAVLAQLQQGKANKIIAYELGMSESTAKVHIRNIMRKMGATNRTQAAFNALKFCSERSEGTFAM